MYYELIKNHYGDKQAERSSIMYIQHIDEGLMILDALKASQDVKDAFCVHPILQIPSSLKATDVSSWKPEVVLLAMEYRNKANTYSSHMGTKPPKMVLSDVTTMLIADKIQNYKDFLEHSRKYPNATELNTYFINWLQHLKCNKYMYMLISGDSFHRILEELRNDNE